MQAFTGTIQRLSTIALIAGCLFLVAILPVFCAPATDANATTVTAKIEDWARVTVIPPPQPMNFLFYGIATVNAEANFDFVMNAYWSSWNFQDDTKANLVTTNLYGPHDACEPVSIEFQIGINKNPSGGVTPTTGVSNPVDSTSFYVGVNEANYGTITVQVSKAP